MLEVRGVSKAFGPTQALEQVSITAKPGEVLGLVGENGSGKSTLMRILTGEIAADSGEILLDAVPYDTRLKQVFLVHQELALCPHMTVAENMFLGHMGGGYVSIAKLNARAAEILNDFGYPDLSPAALISDLPTSLCQVVEIARSQAIESPVILLDEPTSSLTERDVQKLFQLIRRMRDRGKTIVLISHFLEEIRAVADRVTVLRDGRDVASGGIGEFTDDQLIQHMVGRKVTELFPRSNRTPGEVVLEVAGLHGVRKPVEAALALRRGEVAGIAGLNGAGRTEMIRSIMRLDPVVSGRVSVKSINASSVRQCWHSGMGIISEDRQREGLAQALSISENIVMPSRTGLLSRPKESDTRAQAKAAELNVRCSSVEQPVSSLSGGNQQKVALARLLDASCDVLLLDEPTRGIDVASKAEIYRIIDTLAQRGTAILMVSSYLPELLGVCDRIAVMNRGRLSEFLPIQEASADRLMEMCVA